MKKNYVIILLCTFFHSGLLDDVNNLVTTQDLQTSNKSFWPFPVTGIRRRNKPCTKKINNGNNDNEWTPSFRAQIKPLMNYQNVYSMSQMQPYIKQTKDQIENNKYFDSLKLRESTTTEDILHQNLQDRKQKVFPTLDWNISEKETKNENIEKSVSDIYYNKIKDNTTENFDSDAMYSRNLNNPDNIDDILNNDTIECDETSLEEKDGRRAKFGDHIFYLAVPEKVIKCMPIKTLENTNSKSLRSDEPKIGFRKRFNSNKQIVEHNKAAIDFSGIPDMKNEGTAAPQHQDLSRKTNARSSFKNTRICYACSSVTDPNCWKPDKMTTVKYCRQGHDTCISKTIKSDNELIMVRDCGVSCEVKAFPDLISQYDSCSVCHTDLCNSASIITHNLLLLFIITNILKCAFLNI